MERRNCISVIFALSLLAQALCAPTPAFRLRRAEDDSENSNKIEEISISSSTSSVTTETNKPTSTADPFDDDDDDDFGDLEPAPSGGGSNVFSILRLLTALFPGSSSANIVRGILRKILSESIVLPIRRSFVHENEIDYKSKENLPFQRQENDSGIESDDASAEKNSSENDNDFGNDSKQDTDSDIDSVGDSADNDSDEPPGGGDGGGGGVLGLLAGLSGGEDGQSDLGSLLATFSGIIANLSGDGIDLNSLIASGIGLFVGLLSEGEENPGAVIASYLLTSLDTITGGGAKNNGEFFGTFLSKLVKGTSAADNQDASSEDTNNKPMADSAGFVASFLISLLGDMSKLSSGGSHPW